MTILIRMSTGVYPGFCLKKKKRGGGGGLPLAHTWQATRFLSVYVQQSLFITKLYFSFGGGVIILGFYL